MSLARFVAASLFALLPLSMAAPSIAQDYDRPPPGYGAGDDQGGGMPDRGGEPQDAGGMAVRIGRLESRIREMTGQIEELQNANRKLVQQLQKFQQDVDARLASGAARSKRSEASEPASPSGQGVASVEPESGATKPTNKARRDDAYDPSANPSSDRGQPKPLGSPKSAQPDDAAGAPIDLSGGRLRSGSSSDTLAPTLKLQSATPKTEGGTVTSNGTIVASTGPVSPRAAFDQALGLYKGKQYEDAEKGFVAFIEKNPKSRLAADATYYLGESFAQRGRSREAAEQYLKVSKEYSASSRAPEALLHLGMALMKFEKSSNGIDPKEQACATFSEVTRRYPNAPSYVKSGVERESKRAQC